MSRDVHGAGKLRWGSGLLIGLRVRRELRRPGVLPRRHLMSERLLLNVGRWLHVERYGLRQLLIQ